MKKNIIFLAYNLELGGIEKALLSLLNALDYSKYDISLILEKKEGILLNEIPKEVNVIEYNLSSNKNLIIRKVQNRLKLIKTILNNKNKYDFAASFATWSIPMAKLARKFSKNNAIWMHADYTMLYEKDESKVKKFANNRNINKYKNIVFVANEAKQSFLKIFPKLESKCLVINNLINSEDIINKSKEKIKERKPKVPLFLNVSRHDEKQKKLTRLINACEKLSAQKIDFEVWLIGDGPDTKMYENLINQKKLNDKIKLLGVKKNPYPYFKLADYFILTSDYEGFPVVYVESLILNIPLLTTIDVTDDLIKIKDKYGIILEKNIDAIYNCMRNILIVNKRFYSTEKFDVDLFNKNNLKKVEKIINYKFGDNS